MMLRSNKQEGCVAPDSIQYSGLVPASDRSSPQDPTNPKNRGIPLNKNEEDTATPEEFGINQLKAAILLQECKLYMMSFLGPDNVSNNTDLHGLIEGTISGRYPSTYPMDQEVI
jgi:hypothetical protein